MQLNEAAISQGPLSLALSDPVTEGPSMSRPPIYHSDNPGIKFNLCSQTKEYNLFSKFFFLLKIRDLFNLVMNTS